MSYQAQRTCAECSKSVPGSGFSKTQWKKGSAARCSACCAAASRGGGGAMADRHAKGSSRGKPPQQYTGAPTEVSTAARPQRAVPGFEHAPDVTYAADWPQTKSGRGPPGAQSAIFMPLLGCALGPIEGHCTAEQLQLAERWWAAALPAWPRWIAELRASGVAEGARREQLLRTAKGSPNPLIPKSKGRGRVPHFQGKVQNRVLEEAGGGMLSIELYACVTCLYSQGAIRAAEAEEVAAAGGAAVGEGAGAAAGAADDGGGVAAAMSGLSVGEGDEAPG